MRDPLRVLVVEDDMDHAACVIDALRIEGHQVEHAVDAGSALACALGVVPDAVLLDLNLPDKNGYELARDLRDHALAATSVIIMITGAKTTSLDRADAAGIDLVLHKPVTNELLAGLINHVRSLRRRKRISV